MKSSDIKYLIDHYAPFEKGQAIAIDSFKMEGGFIHESGNELAMFLLKKQFELDEINKFSLNVKCDLITKEFGHELPESFKVYTEKDRVFALLILMKCEEILNIKVH